MKLNLTQIFSCLFVTITIATPARAADIFRDLVIIGEDPSYKLCVGCWPGDPLLPGNGMPREVIDVTSAIPGLLLNDDGACEAESDWLLGSDRAGTTGGFSIQEGRYHSDAFHCVTGGSGAWGDLEPFRPIFEIASDARTSSMVIGANGVGLGTAAPAQDLHLQGIGGDAGIRFDQGGQQWDLRGKSDQFWLRDVTSSKDLLVMTKDARLGVGTSYPETALHINRSTLPAIRLETVGQKWDVKASSLGFWINNATAGASHNPFIIDSTARHLALVLQGSGVGLGTAPTLGIELEIAAAVPEIRLSQTSGISRQWDVFASDGGFGVQDETAGGNTVPFRIEPGAFDNSLRIDSTGNVGFGTAAPLEGTGIHVVRSGFVIPTFESSDGNAVQFRLRSDSPNNRRVVGITNAGVVKSQLRLDDGAVILQGQTDANRFALFNAAGLVIEGGTCLKSAGGMACDAVFDPGYGLESIEEHAAAMWDKGHLPAVGPTPEGKPVSFNVVQRHFGILNELEKAHIYIERLNEQIKEQNEQAKQQKAAFETALAAKDRRLAELESRLAGITALEQRMARMEELLAAHPPADD